MPKGFEVMEMLIPTGGWIITGNDYEGIQFLDCDPITKKEYDAGCLAYPAWKTQQETKAKLDRANATAKLETLGLTADDLKALGL